MDQGKDMEPVGSPVSPLTRRGYNEKLLLIFFKRARRAQALRDKKNLVVPTPNPPATDAVKFDGAAADINDLPGIKALMSADINSSSGAGLPGSAKEAAAISARPEPKNGGDNETKNNLPPGENDDQSNRITATIVTGPIVQVEAKKEPEKPAGENVKEKNHQPPKETGRIKIAWKNTGAGNTKTEPDAVALSDLPAALPKEPEETLYSETAWTVVTISGNHPGQTTLQISKKLYQGLAKCRFDFVDPLKKDLESGGVIFLRGAQWPQKALAAILAGMEYKCQTFTSMAALENARLLNSRLTSAIEYEIKKRTPKTGRPR